MAVSGVSCQVTLSGQGGAASGTPMAGAWSEFVGAADGIGSGLDSAAEDLSRALAVAAHAYWLADQSVAGSFGGGE